MDRNSTFVSLADVLWVIYRKRDEYIKLMEKQVNAQHNLAAHEFGALANCLNNLAGEIANDVVTGKINHKEIEND